MASTSSRSVLVVGATGYVGARLVPRLLDAGHRVRAMGRSAAKLRGRPWANDPRVELVVGDALVPESLDAAMRNVDVVYHLVHSLAAGQRFEETDRRAAQNVAAAASRAGVSRIIYLGGLGDDSPDLSPHLRSRAEVDRILRVGSVPVTTLRAAIILGAGSSSYEILRYLARRLPVMITPRWLETPVQPIAIRDVLRYLVGCLDSPETIGATFDIGCPDVVTYRRLIDVYAKEAGLRKRLIVPVPFLTPRLSTYWIYLVTPAPAALVRPLAEGLRNPVVCRDDRIRALIPGPVLGHREAIREAIESAAQPMSGDAAWTLPRAARRGRARGHDRATPARRRAH